MVETKVFVSSRLEELKKERKWAKEVIEKEMGHEAILFEKEPPASEHIKQWWSNKIRDSKFYVLIIGKYVSSPIFDEFKTAIECDRFRLIFVKDESLIKNKKLEFDKNISNEDIEWFYHKIQEFHKYVSFKGKKDLKDNIRKGINQYISLPDNINRELWHHIIKDSNRDYGKLEEIYVKPRVYSKASEILQERNVLILHGAPHIGKTSTARKLAIDIKKNLMLDRILELEPTTNIILLRKIKNSVIVFDDAFGESSLESTTVGNKIREITTLSKNNNHFIITSRSEILLKAKEESRIETDFLFEDHVVELGESDYSEENLKGILQKHLSFYRVDKKGQEWAIANSGDIVKNLNFPHNIEVFVRDCLKDVKDRKSFIEAIKKAKKIEVSVKNWFFNLDQETKYFVITIASFGKFDEEIYRQLLRVLDKEPGNIDRITKKAQPYVAEKTFGELTSIDFKHRSYKDGVLQGVLEEHWGEIEKILLYQIVTKEKEFWLRVPFLMLFFAKHDHKKVMSTLRGWAKKDLPVRRVVATSLATMSMEVPNDVFPIVKELLRDEDNFIKVKCIISLGGIGEHQPIEVLKILKQILEGGDNKLHNWINRQLIRIYEKNPNVVLPEFKKWIKYYPELKINIALGIADHPISDEEIYELLEGFIVDDDEGVVNAAVYALSKFSNLKLYNKLKKDENPKIRAAVVKALPYLETGMYPREHYDELIDFLKSARQIAEELENDEDRNVRGIARESIEKLNKQIDGAKEDLEEFYKEQEKIRYYHYLDEKVDEIYGLSIDLLDNIYTVLEMKKANREIEELNEFIRSTDEKFYERVIEIHESTKEWNKVLELEPDFEFLLAEIRREHENWKEKCLIVIGAHDADYLENTNYLIGSVYKGLEILTQLNLIDKIE